MPAYRLYRLDVGGKIVGADWIAADSDAEALEYARDRAGVAHFELWERKRRVSPPNSGTAD